MPTEELELHGECYKRTVQFKQRSLALLIICNAFLHTKYLPFFGSVKPRCAVVLYSLGEILLDFIKSILPLGGFGMKMQLSEQRGAHSKYFIQSFG